MNRKLAISIIAALAMLVISVGAQDIWNPATGVYIKQKGDLYQGDTVSGNLYYTRYANVDDRVKRVTFRYNGLGYFRLENKMAIAKTNGADGIIHHPDGDLLVGGQGAWTHKVNKETQTVVTSVTDSNNLAGKFGIYHLMMDPNNEVVWGAGIPGYLFRYPAGSTVPNRLGTGKHVPIRGDDTLVCTLAWDENGQTFYTSSDYNGIGSFGWIDMNTMTTHRLFSNLKGPHGMSYDSYSRTILVYGEQRIVQIDPVSRNIIATLDFKVEFAGIGRTFRFDQGTTDAKGHIYVADNNGYLAFVDFTSNPNKRIDNNILMHVQFLDNELDDVAPLSGAGSERKTTVVTSSGSGFSSGTNGSSSNQFISSSSRPSSSSGTSSTGISSGTSSGTSSVGISSGTSSGTSSASSSIGLSSGASSTGTSSGTSSDASSTGTSSGTSSGASSSEGTSSGTSSEGTSSGTSSEGTSSGTSSGSSSESGGSSSGMSSGSSSTSMSSSIGASGSGGSVGDPSSSVGASGSGGSVGDPSSSVGTSGSGGSVPDWADSTWDFGGTGGVVPDDGDEDDYPSQDKRETADSTVIAAQQLVPLQPGQPFNPADTVMIGNNAYLITNTPGNPMSGFGPGSGTTGVRDSVPVGAALSLDLDIAKLQAYFGAGADSLIITGSSGLQFLNPEVGGSPNAPLTIPLDGSTNRIWIVSDTTVAGGYITFTSPSGKVLRYDGINFFDPIPDPEAGLLKDSDGDGNKDAIEVFLERALDSGYTVHSVDIRYNGTVLTVDSSNITLSADRTRFTINVEGSGLSNYTVQPSDLMDIHFTDGTQIFDRQLPLQEVASGIIARATVIRGLNGRDSLFIEYNVDLSNEDLALKNSLVLINGQEIQVDIIRQPGRRLIILESSGMNWTGADSIQLHELATFVNLPYIVDEEYSRKVPVSIVERVPAMATGSGYYDSNGDGIMDSVVIRFDQALTSEQLSMLNLTIPWYSYRNRLIQLMPAANELMLDPNDSSVVIWRVRSNVEMRSGMTTIPQGLPPVELYIAYPVFGSEFVEHRTFMMQDLMAPAITDVRLRYSEEGDTLIVSLSEAVDYRQITRTDIFKYVHGGDTLVLRPLNLIWSDDGKTVRVVMLHGQVDPVIPGDFLLFRGDGVTGGEAIDMLGNTPERDTKPALVQGGLNHLVQSSNMGVLSNRSLDSLALKSTVSIAFVDGNMRSRDMREQGKVGQLIELGQRFMPQLVDQAGIDPDSLDPSRVSITVSTYYFDNQGQYVADTIMPISCTHPAFGGNCLNTDKKMFIDWNFKNNRGRFVGTGVYIANFNLIIRYEGVTIKEDRTERVGVRRTK